MKKFLSLFVLFYSFSAFATSYVYVEPIYYLTGKEDSCIYGMMGELCKSCDSPESFRIVKLVLIDENGKHVEADETACPQRKLICDEDGPYCYSVLKECPKNFPLRAGLGCSSCDEEGMLWVKSKTECDVCSNRKTIQKGENLYCVFKNPPDVKKAPQNKPLVLKYRYQYCGYCVDEDDIVDCSKCLDDYEIINGKCKRKPERGCFQA